MIVLRPFEQELVDTLARVDRENTEWLGSVIDQQGWPTRTLVGDDGARNAWLLAQRADRWRPRTLADPESVNERRAAVGLDPLATYLSIFEEGRHRL